MNQRLMVYRKWRRHEPTPELDSCAVDEIRDRYGRRRPRS